MHKPGVCITILHWILLPLNLNAATLIIPAIIAMQKKPGICQWCGVKPNLIQKLFYAVFVKVK